MTNLGIFLLYIFGLCAVNALRLKPPEVAEGVQLPSDLWFDQKLDHFNPTDERQWNQRYFINDSFYEPGGPLFLMIGGEGPASPKWMVNGSWVQYARTYKAYMVQLEHRFYGKSHPTPDMSVENLRFLSSEQALADLAYFVVKFKQLKNLTDAKVVSFGGSYPGSLAVWFRLKYPHVVHASVSSSAPLVAQINFKEYLNVVTDSIIAKGGTDCLKYVSKATSYISLLLQHRVGWQTLQKMFKLCTPLNGDNKNDVSNLFETVAESFEDVVQYNEDNRNFAKPEEPLVTVTSLCAIMGNKSLGNALDRYAIVNSVKLNSSKQSCLNHTYEGLVNALKKESWDNESSAGGRQWIYQTCTEFGFYQTSDSKKQPFGSDFPLPFFLQQCSDIYGKKFDLDLLKRGVERTNIMYGGRNPKVSRVVLINGSIDPWHYLGVTKSLNSLVPAIFINGTAHCANMYPERADDNEELKNARKEIEKYIGMWLKSE